MACDTALKEYAVDYIYYFIDTCSNVNDIFFSFHFFHLVNLGLLGFCTQILPFYTNIVNFEVMSNSIALTV